MLNSKSSKNKARLNAAFAAAVVMGSSTFAHAAPTEITTRDGRGADAQIQGGQFATKNFGTGVLGVKVGMLPDFARKTYLRFDLAKANNLATLDTATLQLTLAAPTGVAPEDKEWTLRVWGMPDANAGENWDEKTLTWETAPINDIASFKALAPTAVALGTLKLKGMGKEGDIVTFFSPELAAWLKTDTDKLATLILTRDEAETGATDNLIHLFQPKEQSKMPRPTLSLNFKG